MATAKYAKDQPQGFTNRIERVAIVGAGGQVGKYIAEEILKTGKHTVTALSRIGSDSKLPDGVNVVNVDYDDEQSVIDALKGHQFLFISLAVTTPPDTQAKIVNAAAKAGVRWIMPNVYGIDGNNKKLATENLTAEGVYGGIGAIEKTGVASWVAMSCSFWYEFSLAIQIVGYGIDSKNKKITFYDDGKTIINTSTWVQCGRAAAALVSLNELPQDENDTSTTLSHWRNKYLYISSFRISQRAMLDSLNRVQGTTDADWDIEHEGSEERFKRGLGILKGGDFTGYPMALYARTFYPNGDGDFESKYGLANEVLGLPVEDLDEATRRALTFVK
ncbi:hypothetical protein PT974_10057 [Cladobotryum mycophilum]|uniref:NAD(P)-binding domain-containing protein n=1 Tax=Cladobotryum mycophilum TaxID=491253 RepID=A0ABR0S8Y2_9HYPO